MGYKKFCFRFLGTAFLAQVEGIGNSDTMGATVNLTRNLLNTKRLNTRYYEDQLFVHFELNDDETLHPQGSNASNLRSLLGDLFKHKSQDIGEICRSDEIPQMGEEKC